MSKELQVIEIERNGKRFRANVDINGNITLLGLKSEFDKMLIPVHCNHCGRNYDLCDTEVVHRYADCTQYKTPCCKKLADDREWKSFPDFVKLKKD